MARRKKSEQTEAEALHIDPQPQAAASQPLPVPAEPNKPKQTAKKSDPNLPAPTKGQAVQPSAVPVSFPEMERRSFWGRALVLLLAFTVLATSVLIFIFRPSRYDEQTDAVNFFYRPETNTSVVAVNGKVRGEITGEVTYKTYNATGSVCAAIAADRLYVVKGKKVTEIAGEVKDCVLSSNGRVLAYRNAAFELYYLEVGAPDERSRISGSTEDGRYALSPDGKELFYTFVSDGKTLADIYSRTGTRPYLSGNEELYPVAVADDCKYLYYTNKNGNLYMMIGKTGDKVLCGDSPNLSEMVMNRDCSQILFRNGLETRFYRDGERVLMPQMGGEDHLQLMANQRVAVRRLQSGYQYQMESLFDNYYLLYTGTAVKLVFLEYKKDLGAILDVSFVDGPQSVTVTDKSVFFLSTSQGEGTHTNLYRCAFGESEKERMEWDVQTFCPNVDGSRILYTDLKGALFSCRVGQAPVRLCDSVVVDSLSVTADDAFYFYREEGKLWVSDNGEAPRAVKEGVGYFKAEAHTAYYVTNIGEAGTGTVFSNHRNSRKDTEISQNVGSMK